MKSHQKVQIHFVTGKGGVGKSTIAAALALRLSKQGKKTLLVELGNQSFYSDYFGLDSVEYAGRTVRENLDIALWRGLDCLREYARYLLKIETVFKLFFENPVTKTLVSVAPALSELSILGKITSGPPRNVGPELNYDCLVVDTFSTGHFLAMMRAPQGMSEAFKFGPMGEQSRAIFKVLSDAKICKYWVVSIPEEMPVQEGIELSELLEKEIHIRPKQVLNRFYFDLNVKQSSSEFLKFIEQQQSRQQSALRSLQTYSVLKVPQVFELDPWQVVEKISESFEQKDCDYE